MILDLHRQGAGVSAIARRTGLDRKTVRKVIATGLEPPAYGPRQAKVTQLEPFERYLRERLAVVPELTGRRLHRELAAMGYHGGYTAVTDLLREMRPITLPSFEVRFETAPGRQAQVDFAHFRTVFTDEPGVERVVWLFSLVLGHSRMLWGRFVPQQDMQTVLRCHAAAFEALGGAPGEILYDRMKTVVDREVVQDGPEAGHIVYNRTLIEFARHYGYLPKACKAYRAKTKGKVERPFRYIREDFFLGRSFRNRDDLNGQFRQWLDQVANARVHATTHRVVSEHFAEERPSLQKLPAGPFQAGNAPGAPHHQGRHGLRRRQSLQRARYHKAPPGRGAQHGRRGPHPRAGHGNCHPRRHGGPRSAPDHGRTSDHAGAHEQPDAAARYATQSIR